MAKRSVRKISHQSGWLGRVFSVFSVIFPGFFRVQVDADESVSVINQRTGQMPKRVCAYTSGMISRGGCSEEATNRLTNRFNETREPWAGDEHTLEERVNGEEAQRESTLD